MDRPKLEFLAYENLLHAGGLFVLGEAALIGMKRGLPDFSFWYMMIARMHTATKRTATMTMTAMAQVGSLRGTSNGNASAAR